MNKIIVTFTLKNDKGELEVIGETTVYAYDPKEYVKYMINEGLDEDI